MKKLFVWDFHGTLEKGNDAAVLTITNMLLEQQGHSRRMTMLEAELLAGKRWHEYFAFLLPGLDHAAYAEMQRQSIEISQKNPHIMRESIKINHHAHDVLEAINQSPHTQVVVSNTQPHSLDLFLQAVNIEKFFPSHHRVGVDTHTQNYKTKKDWLHLFLDQYSFGSLVTIGDSPGDVALAECHPSGISYLYSYPERPHRPADCHYKITCLREVLREI